MAQRKLQQEIDKTFKRVAEGVQAFEGIYDKLQQSTNPSQKEKLEDNLKKEIKKLQRSRDQIKAWAAQNDIKDKKPLLDQRKLIETQMEKFKAVEKEMKTKAFSKEGLSAAAKLDPKEKEKLEICDFLGNMVEELERQIEVTEAEAETLQANMKKGKKDTAKADRIAELERMAERQMAPRKARTTTTISGKRRSGYRPSQGHRRRHQVLCREQPGSRFHGGRHNLRRSKPRRRRANVWSAR